ncbi:MAG: DNA-3-methyladenine glycosylase [Gemmatimonadaceae bacterium]|nr:DNA-3-methyladenine glycosylase [Gemmatimonadaceae bacterium]
MVGVVDEAPVVTPAPAAKPERAPELALTTAAPPKVTAPAKSTGGRSAAKKAATPAKPAAKPAARSAAAAKSPAAKKTAPAAKKAAAKSPAKKAAARRVAVRRTPALRASSRPHHRSRWCGRGVSSMHLSGMSAPLPPDFYDRDPALVARELLGMQLLVRDVSGRRLRATIVETEAYLGPHDPACHAVSGRTRRTMHLHGPPGRAYVYRIYGMHWCLNAVTLPEGVGSAVLLRAVEPIDALDVIRARRPAARRDRDLTNGPGKLCAAYDISGAHDGTSLQHGAVRIVQGVAVSDDAVSVSPRIGITRAADWPLRFFVAGNPYVSATPAPFVVTRYTPHTP